MLLPHAIVFKEVVDVADDYIAPLTTTHTLINQVVYLFRKALCYNTK